MPKKTTALLATMVLSIGSLLGTSTIASAAQLPFAATNSDKSSLVKAPTENVKSAGDATAQPVEQGCAAWAPDNRTSNVKLTVTKPDVIDVTKPMTFTVHGTGYDPKTEAPASAGVYILVDSIEVWRINKCLTLTGDGGLFARWIPSAEFKNGEFTYTFTVPADTFKKGHTYSIGAIGAHAAALSTRYFDRGIELKIPGTYNGSVKPVKSVTTEITGKKKNDVKVNWDFDGDYSAYKWRASIECVDKCTSVKKVRAIDLSKSADRSYTFEDSDNGIYVPSVIAMKEVGGKYIESDPVKGKKFAIGVELPPEPAPQAPAATVRVPAHNLSWSVTNTYAKYLAMPFVGAKVTSTDGAVSTFTLKDPAKGAFVFPYAGTTPIDVTSVDRLSFKGSNRVTGHKGVMDTTISNPALVKNADGTWALKATLNAKSREGKHINVDNGTVLTGAKPSISVKNGLATFVFSGFTFAKDGSNALGNAVGNKASDITVTVPTTSKDILKLASPGKKMQAMPGKKAPLSASPTSENKTRNTQKTGTPAQKCYADPTKNRVTSGTLSWGLRSSFTNYVQGSIAKGAISPKNVTFANRQFMFKVSGGHFDTTAQTGTVYYAGSVHFSGHDGKLNMTISNPSLVISGKSATLYMNVSSSSMDGKVTNYGKIAFAKVALSKLSAKNGTLSFDSSSVSLTETGAKAFAGFYKTGEALDNLSGTAKMVPNSQCTEDGKLKVYDDFGNVSYKTNNADGSKNLPLTGTSVLPQAAFALLAIAVGGVVALCRRQKA
ncbi:HtaA domain-containing protein [Arcanobacterium canis]|uniref:HtaA domain-containing protein n=1 Tax=Arcanobacterium canis TaxID=999183 RepID=A0ABY8FXM3_9ACTO|nr:HtaA domain-containing protein [Arcanobacterium canis]WFM83097.1 HtaA domain-containing protein [Arcanobacterium canis]